MVMQTRSLVCKILETVYVRLTYVTLFLLLEIAGDNTFIAVAAVLSFGICNPQL